MKSARRMKAKHLTLILRILLHKLEGQTEKKNKIQRKKKKRKERVHTELNKINSSSPFADLFISEGDKQH